MNGFGMLTFCAMIFAAMQAHAEGANCMDIADPTAKMDCYHGKIKELSEEQTSNPTGGSASKWFVSTTKSPLDDSDTVTAILQANAKIAGPYGGSDYPLFVVRCAENTTSAYFTFADHFMADIQGFGRIDFRVDDQKAFHKTGGASTDNKALGFWSGGKAIPFVKNMADGGSLFVRATPFNESQIGVTFSIKGMDAALDPISRACGW